MADTINPLRVSAPDLIDFIESKQPLPTDAWNELGPAEMARSFTAARTAGYDVIDDLYYALVDATEKGATEQEYAAMVMPILREKGWLKTDQERARRVDLIFTQNTRLAQAAGYWDRIQRSKAALPYLRGVTVRDPRVRHPPKSPDADHRAWDGIILPVDHDFWLRYWPPIAFRCRCSVIQMTRSQLAKYPGGITSEANLAARIERLGPQIFPTPGAGMLRQLESMVERTNEQRMPGLPPIVPDLEQFKAGRAWDDATRAAAYEAIEILIQKLFGQAA